MTFRLVRSARADARIAAARAWLAAHPPSAPVLVVAAPADAANDLLRSLAAERGAAFGWHRATLPQLASQLATPALVERGLAPLGALPREAVATRVLRELAERGALERLGRVLEGPGLARAVASVLLELRQARIADADLARVSPELAAIAAAYRSELARDGLADRAEILALATETARAGGTPPLGCATLLLD